MIEMLLQADRLLTVDMVDQADAIYRRVAEQDPRNAIAVVGMARCALARGEDQEAYRLASRALAIDPENDMARRMTARMAEVLAYRGDAVPETPAPTPRPASPVTVAAPAAPASAAPASAAPASAAPASAAPASGDAHPGSEAPTADQRPDTRSWLDRILGR